VDDVKRLTRTVAFDQKGKPMEHLTSGNHPQGVVCKTRRDEISR